MPAVVAGQGGAVLDGVLERVIFANPETGYRPEGAARTWSPQSAHCSARRSASSFACAAAGPPTRSTAGSSRWPLTPRCCRPPVSRNRDPKSDSAEMSTSSARISMHEMEYSLTLSTLPAIAVEPFHRSGRESDRRIRTGGPPLRSAISEGHIRQFSALWITAELAVLQQSAFVLEQHRLIVGHRVACCPDGVRWLVAAAWLWQIHPSCGGAVGLCGDV